MNKIVFVGIAATIIFSGALGAYAMVESDNDMMLQDFKDAVSDIKEDAVKVDHGFGQVEKDERVYAP